MPGHRKRPHHASRYREYSATGATDDTGATDHTDGTEMTRATDATDDMDSQTSALDASACLSARVIETCARGGLRQGRAASAHNSAQAELMGDGS